MYASLFGVCGSLVLVSGYLRFHIWVFLLYGEASLFRRDVARLGLLHLSGSIEKTVEQGHVTLVVRGESLRQIIDTFVCGACDNQVRPRV